MPAVQKEIYPYSEHLRAWQDQGRLPEVQKRKGEAEHCRLYDQDQPEELRADRFSFGYPHADTDAVCFCVSDTVRETGRGASQGAPLRIFLCRAFLLRVP
jgi:hypothetical protein